MGFMSQGVSFIKQENNGFFFFKWHIWGLHQAGGTILLGNGFSDFPQQLHPQSHDTSSSSWVFMLIFLDQLGGDRDHLFTCLHVSSLELGEFTSLLNGWKGKMCQQQLTLPIIFKVPDNKSTISMLPGSITRPLKLLFTLQSTIR